MESNCELCERLKELTFHHFIPKTLHSNKLFKKLYTIQYMNTHGINVCEDCHGAIHKFHSEKELGRYYNSKSKLFDSEKVRNFVKWIKNR
jgi:hypothetical protein